MGLIKYQARHGRPSFLDTFFDDAFMKNRFLGDLMDSGNFSPATNIIDRQDHFEISMALAGFNKENINIELEGDLLKISGARTEEKVEESDRFALKEFTNNKFTRSFTLPDSANGDKMSAEYKDGILHVNIPKHKEVTSNPKRISIR